MKHNKLFRNIALGIACTLGLGGAIGASAGLFDQKNIDIKEADAADEVIYTHTFASGDFKTDMWWGVDGDVFWADALSSIESDGGTFIASEYLRRFVYENKSGQEIDNIYIPVHFTGDVTVKLMDDATSKEIATKYYHSGDNAISFTDLNTTATKLAANVNRTSGSANSNARLLYGETVVISKTASITVTLDANGGTGGASSVTCIPGEAMPSIAGNLPTRTGYTLNGFFTAKSGGTKYYNANGTSAATYPGDSVTKLYAQWTANTYTVHYNDNKPSNASANVTGVPANATWTYDQNATLGSAPSLTGWTFGGWYKEASCTNKLGNANQQLTKPNLRNTAGTANIYAKWTANKYNVQYNANQPTYASSSVTDLPSSQQWTYDSNATLGSAPKLTGWTFGGWYKEAACTNKVGNAGQALTKPNLATSGTVNLYAKWTANTYNYTYDGNKPSKAPSSYEVTDIPTGGTWTYDGSTEVTLGSAPSLTGYVFDGWYRDSLCTGFLGNAGQSVYQPNLTPTQGGNAKIYAKWKFNAAIQDVVDKINATKTVSYEELTSQIEIADEAYNDLDPLYKAVVDSEGYTHILDNAKAADEVGQMIEDLGTAQDTPEWRKAVETVREAYDALEDKSFIPVDSILKILEDDEAAVIVMDSINAIGDPRWTPTSKNLIDTAQNTYDAYILAGHPHDQVANYQTLVDAHTDYNNVQDFVDKVNAITLNPFEYTQECKDLIDIARNDYENGLSPYQKSVVALDADEYYDLLVNYENVYNAMYLIDQINDMENTPECGEKIDAAREAVDALNPTTEMPLMNEDLLKELNDKEAAWGVMELINTIYPMSYGEECEKAIQDARDAFIALNDDQEQYVVNYDMLTKAEADYEAVNEVVEQVAALGEIRHDEESLTKIEAAREAYEGLSDDQKGFYPASSLQTIVDYEEAYETLNMIYEIGEVEYTHESQAKIEEARAHYDALSKEAKSLINFDDYKVLTNSENSYQGLKNSANTLVIFMLILACLLLLGGLFFIFLVLKRRKDNNDDENNQNGAKKNKTVKAMSISVLPLVLASSGSHYLDVPYMALYIIIGLAVLAWLSGVILLFVFKQKVKDLLKDAKKLFKKNKDNNKPQNASSNEDEEVVTVTDEKGNRFQIRYIHSFTAKLIRSNDEVKGYYNELKNEILSYAPTSSRVSWHFDSINSGRNQILKFAIRGKTLCLYYALDVKDYNDTKYKVEETESKKFLEVPCLYRIKNERRLGYAKDLIRDLAKRFNLDKGENPNVNYYLPYEDREPLIARGLIKEQKVQLNKPVEVATKGDEDVVTITDEKGNRFQIRYIKSFLAKLSQANDESKAYYNDLKNEVLSYKTTNSRISWHFDAINAGRNYVVKFAIRGKTLCLYLPLNPDELDEKYIVEKVESKKFEDVPCLYRIKNDRRNKYAKELLAIVASNLGLQKGEADNKDYSLPYEDNDALIAKGLIKEQKVSLKVEAPHHASITVEEADKEMSDEKAEEAIELDTIHHHR